MTTAQAGRTVVFVDDDVSSLKTSATYFSSLGFRTRIYGSGQAMLESLDWSPAIDCVIADASMPDLDGFNLMRELKASGVDAPVILTADHADVSVAVEAMKAGAADVLTKPIEPERLARSVKAAIALRAAPVRTNADAKKARRLLERLTERQRQIVDLIADGLTSKQIAGELGTSFRTVEAQRSMIMMKLDVGTMAELIKLKVLSEVQEQGIV